MKILHIINGLSIGGAETALYRIVKFDKKNEHIIVSLTSFDHYGRILIDEGFNVIKLDLTKKFFNLFFLFQRIKFFKSLKVDIIQGWMYHGNLIAFLIGKIINNKNIFWNIRGPYEKKLTKLSTLTIIYFSTIISKIFHIPTIYNSNYALEIHIKSGFSKKNVFFIANGYILNNFKIKNNLRNEILKKYNIDNNEMVLGMVARMDPHKDHPNLFKALSILKNKNIDFKCLLIGKGFDRLNKDLLKIFSKFNILNNIILVGSTNNVAYYMSLLDIHILSSQAESFPNVLPEAMSLGIPCISTDVGDAKNIIGEHGWIVPKKNPKLLAETIITANQIMQNEENWKIKKIKCFDHIKKNFNINKTIKDYNLFWESEKS